MTKCIYKVLRIVLLATLAPLCVDCAGLNCSDPKQQSNSCASRFDMLQTTMALVNPTGNCSRVIHWYCMCEKGIIKVAFFELPPYIFVDKNGTVDGIIPAITDIDATKMFGELFVKLSPTPGYEYIHLDNESQLIMNKLIASLMGNWSLFVIGLILTLIAGVIIWMLESFCNPDEFPSCFVSGILEGSWWAYISMTTVGYGDKAPKSQIGRLFSVIWILTGVVLVALFTASITSAMTTALLSEKTKLDGKTVGALYYGEFLKYEINPVQRHGGIPKGILMDKLVLRYYWKEIESLVSKNNAIIVKDDVPNSDTAIGLIFKSNQWGAFLKEFFTSNKDADRRMRMKAVKDMEYKLPNPSIPRPVTSNPFNSPAVYKKLLSGFGWSCLVILAIGFGFAIIRSLIHKRLFHRKICSKQLPEDVVPNMAIKEKEKPDQLEMLQRKIEESVLKEIREQFDELRAANTRQVGMSIKVKPAEDVSKF
eukprot:gene19203-21127_t